MNPSDGSTRLQDWHRPVLKGLTAKATMHGQTPSADYDMSSLDSS